MIRMPFKHDKVDLAKLSPDERRLFALYGKTPTNKSLVDMQRGRKYFDSGDYALSKAGRAPQSIVGTAIPNPENIPHASSSGNGYSNGHQIISISPTNSTSPVNKESGLANDENTKVPEDGQLPESGMETGVGVVDETTPTKTAVTENEATENEATTSESITIES